MSVLSRTKRCSSQLESDSDTNISPTGVFANARPKFQVDTARILKRRKTGGLNARFDRMLEDMKLCQQKPARRRARSSGSSSVSSYDIPKTPVDAYNAFSGRGLGQQFSIIKMNHPSHSPEVVPSKQTGSQQSVLNGYDSVCHSLHSDSQAEMLPSWLSNTIKNLDPHHPLRLLLPPPARPGADESTIQAVDFCEERISHQMTSIVPEEASLFAFCPDPEQSNFVVGAPSGYETEVQGQATLRQSLISHQSSLANDSPFSHLLQTDAQNTMDIMSFSDDGTAQQQLDPLPFSTPGPLHSSTTTHLLSNSRALSIPDSTSTLHAHPAFVSTPSDSRLLDFPSNCFSSSSTADGEIPFFELPALDDATLPINSAYNDNAVTEPSAFDLLMHDFCASNPAPFSTPGPTHSLIYFDSPTENLLTDSDPIHSAAELGCDALNFRWEPFDRKGTTSSPSPSHHAEVD